MGKTSRWFQALLGSKKSSDSSPGAEYSRPTKEKKKWGFVRSFNGNDRNIGWTRGSYNAEASSSGPYVEAIDANKHAIAVAAATAAVAEAALAAAQAAAEVVRLTSNGRSKPPSTAYVRGSDRRRELAAVKIQSAFRAYLARRALRALKGLVRLQAVVRGRIVRKQSADMLRRMQAMARIQDRACANRALMLGPSHSSSKSSQSRNPGLATHKKYDNQLRPYSAKSHLPQILKLSQSKSKIKDSERTPLGSNWLDRWMKECSWNNQGGPLLKTGHADDERSDKILEVDTWKPHLNSKQSDRNFRTAQRVTAWNYIDQGVTTFNPPSRHSTQSQKQNPSISSGEFSSLTSLKFVTEVDQAENSPQVYSASSRPGSSGRRGPFTPARSECSRSFISDYLGYPNYMATTESSLARVRSQSAPRQRMQVQTPGSTKRFVHGLWDAETIPERGSATHANFRTSASDRLGIYNSHYSGRC